MTNRKQPGHPENGFPPLRAIRKREGISLRAIARRMQIPMWKAREQEEGRCDLRISDLTRWKTALKVPMSELLQADPPKLSDDIRQRACLLRAARTAKSLMRKCPDGPERRLAGQIVEQLHTIMPELQHVGAWPEGQKRPKWDLGKTADQIPFSDFLPADSEESV